MKLLTLNAHSLVEENYSEKLKSFTSAVCREIPDIIALQEVNQTQAAAEIPSAATSGFTPCGDIPVKEDNHALNVVKILAENGIKYYWTWLGMKFSYGKYDEGIALFSRSKIIEAKVVLVSGINDYSNWKTRKIIGIRTEENPDTWYYSVHLGWWDDKDDPFQMQWQRLDENVKNEGTVWIMGDFNSPAEVRCEGYDMISNSGWYDSYSLAENKDSGITVGKVIDGWRDKLSDTNGMRIDQIWCNKEVPVNSSKVIFNGSNEPIVSDHYGIIIETR